MTNGSRYKNSRQTNLLNALLRAWLLFTLCHLGIYFTHPTVWLTAAEICQETHVLSKPYLLTNHDRLVQDMQNIMLPADKMGTGSTCRERQLHSVMLMSWMSRLYGAGSGWHLLRGVCSKLVNQLPGSVVEISWCCRLGISQSPSQ